MSSSISLNTIIGLENVVYNEETENYILMQLEGKKVESASDKKRAPLNIVALLDLSSSMSDERKIGYLRKSVIKLVEHLTEDDKLSLIGYSSNVTDILSLRNMTSSNKEIAISKIQGLHAQGMTNMSAAIIAASNVFKDAEVNESSVNRIILFTDGCPTSGVVNPIQLVSMISNIPKNVTVSTMGYGVEKSSTDFTNQMMGMGGELNVDLLQEIAKNGSGNYYYMKDPDSCMRAFGSELAGLLTVIAQNVILKVTPSKHCSLKEVMDDLTVTESSGIISITIPDILDGEKRDVLIKMNTIPVNKAWARKAAVSTVSLEYTDIGTMTKVSTECSVKMAFTALKNVSSELNKDVQTHLAIIEAIKAQKEADRLASQGNFTAATNLVNQTASKAGLIGTAKARSISDGLLKAAGNYSDIGSFRSSHNLRSSNVYAMSNSRTTGGISDFDCMYQTNVQATLADTFADDAKKDSATISNVNNIRRTSVDHTPFDGSGTFIDPSNATWTSPISPDNTQPDQHATDADAISNKTTKPSLTKVSTRTNNTW